MPSPGYTSRPGLVRRGGMAQPALRVVDLRVEDACLAAFFDDFFAAFFVDFFAALPPLPDFAPPPLPPFLSRLRLSSSAKSMTLVAAPSGGRSSSSSSPCT